MSRSYRKHPAGGMASSNSNKWWKEKFNRKWRQRTKEDMRRGREVLPERNEVDTLWSSPKDGQGWWGWPKWKGWWRSIGK